MSRSYNNSSREAQKTKTRITIINTMLAQMAEGEEEIIVADLAEKSGVSLRTVYQHFPDKASRVSAIIGWIDDNYDMSSIYPTGFDDIIDYFGRMLDFINDHEDIVKAQMAPGLARIVRAERKKPHQLALKKALEEKLESAQLVKEASALLMSMAKAELYFSMRDTYTMTHQQIKSRLSLSLKLIIENLIEEDALITTKI